MALDGGERLDSFSGHFTPRENNPSNYWIGGWVDSRAGMDLVAKEENLCACRELNPGYPARSLVTILTELPVSTIAHVR
jgi:hypothetical protein